WLGWASRASRSGSPTLAKSWTRGSGSRGREAAIPSLGVTPDPYERDLLWPSPWRRPSCQSQSSYSSGPTLIGGTQRYLGGSPERQDGTKWRASIVVVETVCTSNATAQPALSLVLPTRQPVRGQPVRVSASITPKGQYRLCQFSVSISHGAPGCSRYPTPK